MSNLNFVVQMSKEFSISSCFEPIDVVTLHTLWWPQQYSTYHRPQVSSTYLLYEITVVEDKMASKDRKIDLSGNATSFV